MAISAQGGERKSKNRTRFRKAKLQAGTDLAARIAELRAAVLKRPPTCAEADKAFFDDLSGDL